MTGFPRCPYASRLAAPKIVTRVHVSQGAPCCSCHAERQQCHLSGNGSNGGQAARANRGDIQQGENIGRGKGPLNIGEAARPTGPTTEV
jgi:hypothetical protein